MGALLVAAVRAGSASRSTLADRRGHAESQAERAEQVLRRRIVSGGYAPGERLTEREIADSLGMSRIPVRDALRRLEAYGLVTTGQGTFVSSFTPSEIDELFDLRIALDRLAAQRAARRHAAGLPDAGLAAAIEGAPRPADGAEHTSRVAANMDFHTQLHRASGSVLLLLTAKPVQARSEWLFTLTSTKDPVESAIEHRRIYQAITSGRVELAGLLAAAHVESRRQDALRILGPTSPESTDTEENR